MARVGHAQKVERLNLARSLLRDHPRLPEAVQRLADQAGLSTRQAYRYCAEARKLSAPLPVPVSRQVLSVRLPRDLVRRLRECSQSTGTAVSELVSRALRAFLASRKPNA